MKIIQNLEVPTGNILIVEGENGKLEMLSLGDYGKDVNIKSDALGLTREIEKVTHTTMQPLTKKWVITISTQYGCSMGCQFCDVPKVGSGRNATFNDLIKQVLTGVKLHPEIKTVEAIKNNIFTAGDYTTYQPYKDDEKALKDAGYDVIVFIASEYEDGGRITWRG